MYYYFILADMTTPIDLHDYPYGKPPSNTQLIIEIISKPLDDQLSLFNQITAYYITKQEYQLRKEKYKRVPAEDDTISVHEFDDTPALPTINRIKRLTRSAPGLSVYEHMQRRKQCKRCQCGDCD